MNQGFVIITWQPLRVDIDEPNDQLPKSEVLSVTT